MDDLISRQAAIEAAVDLWIDKPFGNPALSEIRECLEQLTSIWPGREKGKWTKDSACEFCGFQPWYENDIHTLSYCPNCGADMRDETGELADD